MLNGIERLTAKGIDAWLRRAAKGERLADGGNLHLIAGSSGTGRWAFLFTSPATGKRREAGLGAYGVVGLAAARVKAKAMRDEIAVGNDPLEVRRAERAAGVTFLQCADEACAVARMRWTAADAVNRWDKAIARCATIHGAPIRDLTASDIADVLKRIEKPTTRRHVQLTIRRVFDTAIAKGLAQSNPADARIIGKLVPLTHRTKNQGALHWRDVPAFVAGLRDKQGPAARCLEFIIRTGLRKREAAALRFDEIDLVQGVVHLPADRTKQRRQHDVPLPPEALRIVLEQRTRHPSSEFVWPSEFGRRATHLSHGAFVHLLPGGATVHGFRSALRSFLGDCTTVSYETAEGVLGHLVGDATVRAYRRSTDIARRREALAIWNTHIDASHESVNRGENIVKFQLVDEAAR